MKRIFALFTTLCALLLVFSATASAAGGSESTATSAAFDGPLVLLSLVTLAIFIYLPLRDNN